MNARLLCSASALLAVVAAFGCTPEPCDRSGNICTFAGVAQKAQFGPDDVQATRSPLFMPQDITFAEDGTAYLPDFNNHRIRTISAEGVITTISGTGFLGDGPEGDSAVYAWNHPTNVALDPKDPEILHVAGWHNSRIVQVDLAAGITSFECGTGGRDYAGDGGPAMEAVLDLPSSIAFDSKGVLYISDQANQAIRRVLADDTIELVAGSPGVDNAGAINADPNLAPEDKVQDATAGYAGDGGPASEALIFAEIGQAADPSNKITIVDDVLYFADSGNNVVRKIDLKTMEVELVAGTPWHRSTSAAATLPEAADPTKGDGGQATKAYLNNPRDVAVGIDGEIYIADTDNHCVRVVYPDGIIETFAGKCGAEPQVGDKFVGQEQPALEARFWSPYGVATDSEGNLYISDTKNHVIRRVAY